MKKCFRFFTASPQAGAAFCNYVFIDHESNFAYNNLQEATEEGILENFLYIMAERCATQYVSIAVRRAVYEDLGAFYGRFYTLNQSFPSFYRPQKYIY